MAPARPLQLTPLQRQVQQVISRAADIVGSREKLAERLKVHPVTISDWIAARDECPMDKLHEAAEIIISRLDQLEQEKRASK